MQHIIPLHNTSLFKIPGTEMIFFQLIQFSWAEEQPGCWVVHHLGRSWPLRGVCSAPRRYGWLAGGGGGWSWSSYCLWLHFLPTPKLLLPGILIRLLSIQGHLHQLVQHSSLKKNDIFLIPKFIHFVYTCIYKCFFIWTHNKANFHFYMNFFTTSQWSLHTLIACITENIKSLLSRTILNNSPLSNVTISNKGWYVIKSSGMPSVFTKFDHVTKQVHIHVNLFTCCSFLKCYVISKKKPPKFIHFYQLHNFKMLDVLMFKTL